MGEYAPAALKWLADEVAKVIPSARLSGIVGDSSHTYGYHRARSKVPKSDYSVQLAEDRAGDGDAASAVDISLPPADMRLVTGRLLASAKDRNDPRLNVIREFFGTLDGRRVTGWDCVAYAPSTSDDSHLWHVHLSVLRKYANDRNALAGVLSVITGASIEENDVELTDPLKISTTWVQTFKTDPGIADGEIEVATALAGGYLHARQGNERVGAMAAQVAALSQQVAALTAAVNALAARPATDARAAVAEGLRVAADRVDPPTP